MASSIPREVLKWLLSLDLSYPVKNPRRDFANGFLFAEVLSRYYPQDVQMHSFENVASTQRKKQNWHLLGKLFKKKCIQIDAGLVEKVMAAEGDAAVDLLQLLHDFIHSPDYQTSCSSPGFADSYAAANSSGGAFVDNSSSTPYAAANDVYCQQTQLYPQHSVSQQAAMYGQTHVSAQAQNAYQMQNYGSYQQQLSQQYPNHPYQEFIPMQHQYQQHMAQGSFQPIPQAFGHQQVHAQYANQPSTQYAVDAMETGISQQSNKGKGRGKPPARPPAGKAAATHVQQQNISSPAAVQDTHFGYAQQPVGAGYGNNDISSQYHPSNDWQLEQQAMLCPYQQHDACSQPGYLQEPIQIDNIPFSKARPVEYQPYDIKDLRDKAYNIKRPGGNYWELGRLGPDLETAELQAKREKAERMKELAAQVREENMKKAAAAASKPRKETQKEPTARDKALQFAKTVPKPDTKPEVSPASGKLAPRTSSSGNSARTGSIAGASNGRRASREAVRPTGNSSGSTAATCTPALLALEAQHEEDQRKVEAITAQLARMI